MQEKQHSEANDARLRDLRHKLKADNVERQQLFHYMQGVQPANSRHNVVPGQTEAKEEAIRQQLLLGKLKYNERLPGDKHAFGIDHLGGGSSNHDSPSRFIPSHRFGANPELSETHSAHDSTRRIPEWDDGRGVPQILSDQASGLSGVSSVNHKPRAVAFTEAREASAGGQR